MNGVVDDGLLQKPALWAMAVLRQWPRLLECLIEQSEQALRKLLMIVTHEKHHEGKDEKEVAVN